MEGGGVKEWMGPVNGPSQNLLYLYEDTSALSLLHEHMQNVFAISSY